MFGLQRVSWRRKHDKQLAKTLLRYRASTQLPSRKAPSRGLRHFWSPFMSKTLPVPADPRLSEPCLVVFGRDEAGKPHASWFDAQSADLAVKAADLMNMRVFRMPTEERKGLAAQLARGRVFASVRAFTPYVRASLYGQLVEL